MRRKRYLGLRTRLLLLVLIALQPALILILFGFSDLRHRDKAIARTDAMRLARLVASRKEQEFEGTRDLLMAVTRMPPSVSRPSLSTVPPDTASSPTPPPHAAPEHDARLESLLRQHPNYADIAVADARGWVVRSAVPSAQARNVARVPWFEAARRSDRFVVGEYETSEPGHRPVLVLAFPTSLGQVAFAELDLIRADPGRLGIPLPERFTVSLYDRRGTVLTRRPDPMKWRGASVAMFPEIADILAHPRELAEEMTSLDGRRLWGFSPVHVQGESVALAGVGIPLDIAYADARRTALRGMFLFALMTVLILALTWYIGEMILLPRLRRLVQAAGSVATGAHGVRTGLRHEGDEIDHLAGAFDRMASALDERDAELNRTEDALRQSEANYRLLFDKTPLAAAVYDAETLRFLAVNAMAEKCYGYTRAEFLGLTVLDLFRPEDLPMVYRFLAENAPEDMNIRVWTHRRKDGSCLQVEAVSHFLEFNGRPARLALAMDVTERLQAAESLRDSRDQLRNLANRLQLVREEERTGIAREIHDELGQALTGLKMDLSWLRGRAAQLDGAPEAAGLLARLERMSALTDETVQTVRRIATELRPAVLDALGLVAALEWQSKDFQARSGIQCVFTSGIEEMRLSPECATAVFRIFQEALTNIARHANARSVTARLECVENRICLWIQDDGVGIAPEVAANSRSLGLLGLRERAHVIGADLSIAGRPGEGTRVSLTFPTSPRGCILSGTPCILRDRAGARYQCAMSAAGATADTEPTRDGGAEE